MTVCPYCNRNIGTTGARWNKHVTEDGGNTICPMTKRRVPLTGTTHRDMRKRANLVAELALELRDEDPWMLQLYLKCTPAAELQRLLTVALAAIPVDRMSMSELFGWTQHLTSEPDAA